MSLMLPKTKKKELTSENGHYKYEERLIAEKADCKVPISPRLHAIHM